MTNVAVTAPVLSAGRSYVGSRHWSKEPDRSESRKKVCDQEATGRGCPMSHPVFVQTGCMGPSAPRAVCSWDSHQNSTITWQNYRQVTYCFLAWCAPISLNECRCAVVKSIKDTRRCARSKLLENHEKKTIQGRDIHGGHFLSLKWQMSKTDQVNKRDLWLIQCGKPLIK